jgi:cobalt-zinc-cadmium efflux system outer membrane protein
MKPKGVSRVPNRPRVWIAPFRKWVAACGLAGLCGCASYAPPRDATAPLSHSSGAPGIPWLQPTPGPGRPGTQTASRVAPASHEEPVPPPGKQPAPEPADKQPAGKQEGNPLPPPREVPQAAPPGTRLTLDQVINAVVVSDPQLRAGFEAINQANADALTASLRPNPSLYTDALMLPLTRPFTPFKQGGPPQFDALVTYPIDWYLFGKRAAKMVVAARGVRASEADFEDQVRQRVTEAATGFFDVLEADGLLALVKQDVATLEQIEAATAKAVAAGGKTQVELNRLRLDLAQARRLAREAETALVTAKANLRAMMGRTEADPAFTVEGALDAPLEAALPPADEGFALAVEGRPDLRALRWKVSQAQANIEAERRNAYPSVSPMLGYTRQFQQKAIGFPDASSWDAAATISLPVFDRNQGNRARAASALAQSRFQYDAAVATLRAEVETAAQQYKAARATAMEIAGEQLRLAREVRDAIATAYQAGGRPLVDLLDAERIFRETARAYVSSRAAYWRAVYRYRSAIGQQTTP